MRFQRRHGEVTLKRVQVQVQVHTLNCLAFGYMMETISVSSREIWFHVVTKVATSPATIMLPSLAFI